MGPRRYVALNPADALKQIRAELGPEAVVLSNREVADGVEIVAIRPEDLAKMSGERSVVMPNPDSAPFAALPMPATGATNSPPAVGAADTAVRKSAAQRPRPASPTIPVVAPAQPSARQRAPGASVMARQRRIEDDQPANRPLGSGVKHELVIANVSQRSDRDRRRNPVYPPPAAAKAPTHRAAAPPVQRKAGASERAPQSEPRHFDEEHLDDEHDLHPDDIAGNHRHASEHDYDHAQDDDHDDEPVRRSRNGGSGEAAQGRGRAASTARQQQGTFGPHHDYADEANPSELARDLAEVKRLLQTHVAHTVAAAMTSDTPVRAELLKLMFSAGFSAGMASSMVAEMPEQTDIHAAVRWMQERLKSELQTLDVVGSIDDGGVYAFIGPTGVGKTTMVAKLAARCVLRFGRSQVALLTTDTYRIGAQEQLKVFAKILGLTITSIRDGADLAHKLDELSRKHVVLLDTAGMGQRDQLMIEQLSLLAEGRQKLKRVLVVSATTGLHTLDDVYETYRQALGESPFWGVVLTKLDEAVSLAPMVECAIRHRLPVLFMANGQRVPEDLHVPNTGYLVHRSLRVKASIAGSTPHDDHIPTLIADNLDAWARKKA